jgi:hypothetical protein
MLDGCPTKESDGGEFSQLIHIFSLIGLLEKNSSSKRKIWLPKLKLIYLNEILKKIK